MKCKRLLFWNHALTRLFLLGILFVSISSLSVTLYSQGIIIDHTCTDIHKIPSSWITAAKNNLRCSYGHTSHGSQLITGMSALQADSLIGAPYKFNMSGEITAGVLSIADYTPDGDLGNPDRTTWASRTRAYLNGAGSDRNVVMWSWCGQVSDATATDINTYLNLMNALEADFPGVTFVYMTGHLDGSGVNGNLNVRNNQIRNWCKANNKILFDFADIESYDPSGNYFLNLGADDGCNYSGGNWADQWLAANPGHELTRLANACDSCAHSETLNCVLKGRATWWLMARIAGWNGGTSTEPSITVQSPNGGENWTIGSSYTISWSSTGTVGNVKIEYSIDNGSNWSEIVSSTANDGAYSWTIPDSPSTQCRVRISETDGSPTDTSNAVFTISEPGAAPTITVTSPNGGEEWEAGSTQKITWTTTGEVGNVMIYYSINKGSNWTKITPSAPNTGTYSWTVPDNPSTQCLVKVLETDGSPLDISDAVFTISGSTSPATITVTSPNGGENWVVGTKQKITWTSSGTVGNVMIKYSTDNGSNWVKITASTPNSGTYSWTVPNAPSAKCLVKVMETDGSPLDVSDAVFTISKSGSSPTITVTAPNGGEVWPVGSSQKITWTTTGSVGNVKIKYSINKGGGWTMITSSTENDGSYSWTVPNAVSDQCLVKIFELDGSPMDVSDAVFSIVSSGEAPVICVNRECLNFGYVMGGKVPGSQWLHVYNCGEGTLNWTASADVSWIKLDPTSGIACDPGEGNLAVTIDPEGLAAGEYTGTITISDPNATNSPVTVRVKLKVKESSKNQPPKGSCDTPGDNLEVCGSIPVTGWAIDDVEVENVKIYREEYGSLVYIGDAVFIDGARPDIENLYPDSPHNYGAGWGYMLLTNALPNQGNGHFLIHCIANDGSGKSTVLGSRKILVDNAHAVKPFGAIDAPGQGGIASGNKYKNWGWVLTPNPNRIPTDGSTISVYVDGVKLGHPTYNIYRSDIAGLFPGYANSGGAAGYFYIDTTAYKDGLHSIHWIATDSAGNTDGIGSRYFVVQNGSSGKAASILSALNRPADAINPLPSPYLINDIPLDFSAPVKVLKGYDQPVNAEPEWVYPDEQGNINIVLSQLERLELHAAEPGFAGNEDRAYGCYLVVGKHHRPLPVGSTLDAQRGILYWQPGLGFRGEFKFVFVVQNQNLDVIKKEITITIN